jgi:hypothetical protein
MKLERRSSRYQMLVIKGQARTLSSAFAKDGFIRRHYPTEWVLADLNQKLRGLGLPLAPDEVGSDEEINKVWATYLREIADGDMEFAEHVLRAMVERIKGEDRKLLPPQGTPEETPP